MARRSLVPLSFLALLLGVAGVPLAALGQGTVASLYQLQGDSLLWYRGDRLAPAGATALRLLMAAAEYGLDPDEYDATRLDSAARWPAGAADRRSVDLRLTTSTVRFLGHVSAGRGRDAVRRDFSRELHDAIRADTLPGLVAAMEPRLAQYAYLKLALGKYRLLALETRFAPLPAGRTVHPGEPYEGAARLGRQLADLGDLTGGVPRELQGRYQGELVDAVTRFQERHGLEPDGVLGPATFAALNTPPTRRVRQLELAMERLRRLPAVAGRRVVVVNVPAFRLFALDSARGGRPSLVSRAVVGRAIHTRTPSLAADMRSVEFWPYWNVPRSILLNETLPTLQLRPDYLRRNRMELVGENGAPRGDRVTAATIEGLRRGTLRVRQRPGPGNALGLVKFVFPNAAGIYIHGTSHPELFDLPRRDLSHGCIRVEAYEELATWVLAGVKGWNADSTAAALVGGRTRSLTLETPLPVLVFYTTAAAGEDGRAYFFDDLYGLDARLETELRRERLALRRPGARV